MRTGMGVGVCGRARTRGRGQPQTKQPHRPHNTSCKIRVRTGTRSGWLGCRLSIRGIPSSREACLLLFVAC